MRSLVLSLALASAVVPLCSQTRYFYRGSRPGSESVYNPITLLLNGSFDIFQTTNYSGKLNEVAYDKGWQNVWRNMKDPFSSIRHYGTWEFLANEVLPFRMNRLHAQWVPNYKLHLIGGGMTYVKTAEWYDIHGVPYPEAASFVTMFLYHGLNEVVENGGYSGDNVDPVADLYLFDLGGIVLFSFEPVKKFFSEELNLQDWSRQPSFSLVDGRLLNNGQYFSVKWKIPGLDPWHLFYYFGMDGITGVTYRFANGKALSAGIGFGAGRRDVVDPVTNRQTVTLVWNAGVFYDDDGSLLASATYIGKFKEAVNVNVYPGLISLFGFEPGVWLSFARNGSPTFGVTAAWLPGVAVH